MLYNPFSRELTFNNICLLLLPHTLDLPTILSKKASTRARERVQENARECESESEFESESERERERAKAREKRERDYTCSF